MTADYPVVLDACVLAPANLCDVLLSLAESPRLYLPHRSEEILAETKRTQLVKLNWSESLADYWQSKIRESFPEAMVDDYQPLIDKCGKL